ncbi:hypothetical protein PMIN04_007920 [Paraphaeosphaeria minitans]
MGDTRYGTDSKRFIESGIVQLSQLKQHPHPDPYFHLAPQCRKDQKQLEQRFRHEVCKPWLKENRLKAEVSRSVWEKATERGSKRLDGRLFPCLEFEANAEIYITEGIDMLHIARSPSVWGLAEIFDSLENRWWVLDFYCDDGSNSRQAALRSQHRAVSEILCAPTQRTRAQRLSYLSSLTSQLNQDAHLVSDTVGVPDAFGPLHQLRSLWTTKSFNYLTTIRKSWCIEEAVNYLQHIVSQWKDITLQWHPEVVHTLDPDSIERLQSRAPLLSRGDRGYIGHAFGRGNIFPRLTNTALRESVMKAVCRQGPILTLATFAKDLRALQSRVIPPLASLLRGMRRAQYDTLRKRIQSVFRKEFDVLFESGETQLSRVARQVFNGLLVDNQNHDSCNLSEDGDDIATRTPASVLPSYPDIVDVDVSKRHGVALSKSQAAAVCLYGDQVLEGQFPEPPISQSFMAKHIVCIFLFGGAKEFGACPSSSISSTMSSSSMEALLVGLPFLDRDSISFCTDDYASVSEQSSSMVNESELDRGSVSWRRPLVHGQASMASSKAASVLSADTSPVTMTPSSRARKRPASIFPASAIKDRKSTQAHAFARRSRSRDPSFHRTSPSVRPKGLRSPDRTPQVRPSGFSVASSIPSMHGTVFGEAGQWYGTPEAGSPAAEQYSPSTLVTSHSSAYSPDRCSSVSNVMDLGLTRTFDAVEAYVGLLDHRNPFSSDGSTTVLDTGSEDYQYASQPPTEWPVSDQAGERTDDSLPLEHTMPRANEKDRAITRPGTARTADPLHTVLYALKHKPHVFYNATADARATERFVQRQKDLDPLCTFCYEVDGTVKYATGYQLHHAIKTYQLSIVRVISNRLGNTDRLKPSGMAMWKS